jgi:isoprenylcysteine carboxyl methyltransferase (ICMT) family protein YpbQ
MLEVTESTVLLGVVIAMRLIEVMIARRNAERVIDEGAEDHSGDFYLLWTALQGGGLFLIAATMTPERSPPLLALLFFTPILLVRVGLLIRYRHAWVLRLITTKEGDLIEFKPKRYRYLGLGLSAVESATLALALGLPFIALCLGGLNVALIAYRIRLERSFKRS